MALIAFPYRSNPPPQASRFQPTVRFALWYLGLTYLAVSLLLPLLLPGGMNLYIAQPLLWLTLGVLCRHLTTRDRDSDANARILDRRAHV